MTIHPTALLKVGLTGALFLWASAMPVLATAPGALADQAVSGNPEIRMLEAAIQAARGERIEAGAWKNPQVSGDVGWKEARDSEGVRQGSGVAYSVQLSQTFEFPGKATLRKAIADKNIALAELGLQQFRQALRARVLGLAAEWIAARDQLALAEAMSQEAKVVATALRERPRAGAQQEIEARLIEAALLERKKTSIDLKGQLEVLQAEINQLSGLPTKTALSIQDSFPTWIPPKLDALLLAGGGSHPRIRLRAMEFERSVIESRAARNAEMPDVDIGPFFSQEDTGEVETTVGVAVSLPLPVWNQGRGEILRARSREEQAAAALALAQREAEVEITRLHREWERSAAILQEISPDRLEGFRQAADLASRQFRTGAIPVQLYLEMQREALGVLTTRSEALAAQRRAAALLEQLTVPPSRSTEVIAKKTRKP
jgi:cobalt-zinc-cadmium efflux system outer membrane protein